MNPASLHALADRELSLKARIAYMILLLAALTMTTAVASLWLTEPALKLRTSLALCTLTLIGASWVGFALWVLLRRRVLYAYQGLIATRMALCFCLVAFIGTSMVAQIQNSMAAGAAALTFGVLAAAAGLLSIRAQSKLRTLQARRVELEHRLSAETTET